MNSPTLAQVKKALPWGVERKHGAWRIFRTHHEAEVWFSAKLGDLTPEAVHEAISEPCEDCEPPGSDSDGCVHGWPRMKAMPDRAPSLELS